MHRVRPPGDDGPPSGGEEHKRTPLGSRGKEGVTERKTQEKKAKKRLVLIRFLWKINIRDILLKFLTLC